MIRTLAVLTAAAALALGLAPGPSNAADHPVPVSSAVPTTRALHLRFLGAVRRLEVSGHSHAASYDRDREFGDWITQHGECDTRAVVLIDESLAPVTKNRYCTVSRGRWLSYYNDRYYRNAYGGKVQIDHTVPVYNAWISGAWRWRKKTRIAYYNDLGDARTLVAVDAHDNEVKEGDDPTEWTPSHGLCRYLRYWVAVKTRWHLSVTPDERAYLLQAPCPSARLTVRPAKVHYRHPAASR